MLLHHTEERKKEVIGARLGLNEHQQTYNVVVATNDDTGDVFIITIDADQGCIVSDRFDPIFPSFNTHRCLVRGAAV